VTAVLTRPRVHQKADTVLTLAADLIVRHGFHPFGFGGFVRADSIHHLGYSVEGAIYAALGLLVDNFTLSDDPNDDPRWRVANEAFRAFANEAGAAVNAPGRAFGAVCDWSEGNWSEDDPSGLGAKLRAVTLLGKASVAYAARQAGAR